MLDLLETLKLFNYDVKNVVGFWNIYIYRISVLNKTLRSTLEKASDSLGTQFLKNKQQTPSLTLGVTKLSSHVKRFIKRPIKELGIVSEPSVLLSQLHRWRKEFGPQLDPKPVKQR